MRVLLSWLREFVPVETEPDALAERLSLSGLAVEETIRTGAGMQGVIVGEVRAMREHPDADNLMLVRAADGEGERDIVCGARNYAVGDRVPLALPGARLPGGIEIGRRTVRGETSDGMLCSPRELGLADDHTGILILDPDAPLGKDLAAALELDDVLFDIDVTPNRPDCLSVLGVAREIGALYGLPVTVPPAAPPEGRAEATSLAEVRIADPRGCPRYVARVIERVEHRRSPWWMRRRLMAGGMRPISNLVDVTNYVMLERGQPLHAFDLDRLAGARIAVRRPKRGERAFTTLDGQQRTLDREDVLICDARAPVAIGGVMGGAATEVSEATRRILLESASFDPRRIARTARRLGLRTEASIRFERGVDVAAARDAADLAMRLFADLAGGVVARGAVDVFPRPPKPRARRVRVARANQLIGIQVSADEMGSALRALGCEIAVSRTILLATPPTWRPDLAIEEDFVEEIARLYGYDRVPETLPAGARTGGLTIAQQRRRLARRALLGAGLHEAITLSLLPSALADRVGLAADHPLRQARRLANPLSEDEMVLRPSLIWGLLLAAQRNVARRALPVRLFEIGTVFAAGAGEGAPAEHLHAGWVLAGPSGRGWHEPERALDLFDAKGALESLAAALGVQAVETRAMPTDGWAAVLHPGRAAAVLIEGERVGYLAELHPRTAAALELPRRVAVGIVDLDRLIAAARENVAPDVPRFPSVLRDLALVVPEDQPAAEVRRLIEQHAGALLDRIELFDVYRGDRIPPGTVSLAFTLVFRHPERTLTDADADGAMAGVAAAAAERGWRIRE